MQSSIIEEYFNEIKSESLHDGELNVYPSPNLYFYLNKIRLFYENNTNPDDIFNDKIDILCDFANDFLEFEYEDYKKDQRVDGGEEPEFRKFFTEIWINFQNEYPYIGGGGINLYCFRKELFT